MAGAVRAEGHLTVTLRGRTCYFNLNGLRSGRIVSAEIGKRDGLLKGMTVRLAGRKGRRKFAGPRHRIYAENFRVPATAGCSGVLSKNGKMLEPLDVAVAQEWATMKAAAT